LTPRFTKFWAAKNPGEAQQYVDAILKSGVTFDAAYGRLRKGRAYAPQATGQGSDSATAPLTASSISSP
jgi:hypothetical protein